MRPNRQLSCDSVEHFHTVVGFAGLVVDPFEPAGWIILDFGPVEAAKAEIRAAEAAKVRRPLLFTHSRPKPCDFVARDNLII